MLLALVFVTRLPAQTATGTLRGTLLDPSGGAVPNATVQATSATGQMAMAKTNSTGAYELSNLPAGPYTIDITVSGFTPYKKEGVAVVAGRTEQADFTLEIQAQQQQVTVADQALAVDTSSSTNASSVVLSDKELDALPDDPDELQSDLEALAGPSAGPNGGQMYIDGFTAGQLPPKSSIREIRINQNPFSAEYDKVGYGRIEIFTKPGTNAWHGQSSINSTASVFNARNPFITTSVPPYYSLQANENVGGPLGKNGSLFFNADYRNIDDQSVINAELPSGLFGATVANPRKRLNIGPRVDYQLTKNNTLSVRYQYFWDQETNDGVGSAGGSSYLASQGYNTRNTEQTLQIADTQLFGAKIVNEARFQYLGDGNSQTPQSLLPQVGVLGDFVEGGNTDGSNIDHTAHFELQNYTSVALSKHFLKFGFRLRDSNDNNSSTGGFNGAYSFACLTGCTNALSQPTPLPSQFTLTTGSPAASVNLFDGSLYIEDDWRVRPNITLSGGLRFETQNHIHDTTDFAPRLGVAWGLGGSKTVPAVVLRAGWGIFYDRFSAASVLTAERQNGFTQQSYTIDNPSFYCPNATAPLTAANCAGFSLSNSTAVPIVYQISPNLYAPLLMQSALSVERQMNKSVKVSLSYLNSRGYHQLLTDNVNSPVLPGTITPTSPANGGVYPNSGDCPASSPTKCAIYQFESKGIFNQSQMVVNVTVRASSRLLLNGYYTLNYANSDTGGVGSMPSNPYNLMQDYGRATFDVRDRVFFGGTVSLPKGFSLSPFMIISSGRPYNITIGQDLIGSTSLNQRPGLVSTAGCPATVVTGSIYCTPFGTFDAKPTAAEPLVPINYLTGPSQFSLNLRLAKTFTFGPKVGEGGVGRQGGPPGGGGGGPRGGGGGGGGGARGIGGPRPGGGPFGGPAAAPGRFNFTVSINARNIFNNVNLATPIGVLTSPLFGHSDALAGGGGPGGMAGGGGPGGGPGGNAANRAVYLQGTFAF
jgi:hypothetical protein